MLLMLVLYCLTPLTQLPLGVQEQTQHLCLCCSVSPHVSGTQCSVLYFGWLLLHYMH